MPFFDSKRRELVKHAPRNTVKLVPIKEIAHQQLIRGLLGFPKNHELKARTNHALKRVFLGWMKTPQESRDGRGRSVIL